MPGVAATSGVVSAAVRRNDMLTERTFDSGTVSINYVEGPPSGRPLVILHGISGTWKGFLPVLPQLCARWHVYGLDHRGHGQSGNVANGYRLEDYVSDAVAFIERQAEEPVYLLGHSLGGLASIGVAAAIPHMVKAVVVEDPPVYGFSGDRLRSRPYYRLFVGWRDIAATDGSIDDMMVQLADLEPELTEVDRRFKARGLQQLDPEVLTMYIEGTGTATYDIDALLQSITCPTLFIRGEPSLGGAIEDVDVERVLSLLPHALFVEVADVGHGIQSTKPMVYYQIVSKFLESCE
jgi:pimeloyl-ACP methyl ester carboxylesterase